MKSHKIYYRYNWGNKLNWSDWAGETLDMSLSNFRVHKTNGVTIDMELTKEHAMKKLLSE